MAAGRKSEDALEAEPEEESGPADRDEGILLERAWVSVVRGCEEEASGIFEDRGRECGEEYDKDTWAEDSTVHRSPPMPKTGG